MKNSKRIIALSLAFLTGVNLVACSNKSNSNEFSKGNKETSKITSAANSEQSTTKSTTVQVSNESNSSLETKSTESTSASDNTEAKTLEEEILRASLSEVSKANFKYKFYVILEKQDKWLINYVAEDNKTSLSVEMTKTAYKILNSAIETWAEQDIPNSEEDYNHIADRLFSEIEKLEHGTAGSSLKQVSVAADYLNLITEGDYSSYEFYIYLNEYRTEVAEKSTEAIEKFDKDFRLLLEIVDSLVAQDENTLRALEDSGKSLSESAKALTEADASPYLWAPFDPELN